VTVGVGAVVVIAVMPAQEQALLYLTTPEHALAYAGTEEGTTVTCRGARAASSARLAGGPTVTVTVTVL
jgi:hypothetical protein